MKFYRVIYGNYFPREVESSWETEEEAEARRDFLNENIRSDCGESGMWEVEAFNISTDGDKVSVNVDDLLNCFNSGVDACIGVLVEKEKQYIKCCGIQEMTPYTSSNAILNILHDSIAEIRALKNETEEDSD